MVDMHYCFKKNDRMICKESKDGPVLIDPYRRTLIQLNPTALEVWHLIDGTRSVADIVEVMLGAFEIDEEVLRKDTTSLLKDLMKREIIQ